MNVYKTVLYVSLEKPLKKVIICNPLLKEELWRGDFQDIPETLFEREVKARLYEYTPKTLKLWVCA